MATFVVAHGAWSAGWAWKKMHPLLRAAGHTLVTPTYTGLGERAHLASASIDLETHIQDMLGMLEIEDMSGVTLIGHSYGGMVATGVADRARERIKQLVYLDAFVPENGQALLDLVPAQGAARMREAARSTGEGWRIPPNPIPPDTSAADAAWLTPRRRPQPLKTFSSSVRLARSNPHPARTYIYCARAGEGDVFRQFLERAKRERWPHFEMDASHNPHVTAPDALAALLARIASAS